MTSGLSGQYATHREAVAIEILSAKFAVYCQMHRKRVRHERKAHDVSASDVSRLSFCRDRSQSAALAADQVNDRRAHGGCGDQLSLLDDEFIAGLMVGAFVQQCFEAWPCCVSINVPWMLSCMSAGY